MQQPVTKNVDAYNDYLQARFYQNEYLVYSRVDSMEKGERLLLHAISGSYPKSVIGVEGF